MTNQNVPSVLAHMKTNGHQIAGMGHYVKSTVRAGQAPKGCSEFKSKVFLSHGKSPKRITSKSLAIRLAIEASRLKREAGAKIRNGEVVRKITKNGQTVFISERKFIKNPFKVVNA